MDCSLMAHRKRLMPRKILSYPIKTIYIEIITPLYYYVSYLQYSLISFDRYQCYNCYLNLSIKATKSRLQWIWHSGNHKLDLFYMVCSNNSLFPNIYHLKFLCVCTGFSTMSKISSQLLCSRQFQGQNSAKLKPQAVKMRQWRANMKVMV